MQSLRLQTLTSRKKERAEATVSTGTTGCVVSSSFPIPWPTPPKDPAFRQSEEEGKVEPQQDIDTANSIISHLEKNGGFLLLC